MAIRFEQLSTKAFAKMEVYSKGDNRPIFIDNGGIQYRLRLEAVMYVKSADNYCALYSTDNKKIGEVRSTIKDLVGVLPSDDFIQINRGTVINRWYIESIMGKCIVMQKGVTLDMTDKFKSSLNGCIVILVGKSSSLV